MAAGYCIHRLIYSPAELKSAGEGTETNREIKVRLPEERDFLFVSTARRRMSSEQ